jgi:UDP-N-acetylglucosamine 2-epimerase (non-hydrolysing)
MKVSSVMRALRSRQGVHQTLVHTGQHYDTNLSQVFFTQLDIPRPDINLNVGSGTHAAQTAAIMTRFETIVLGQRPDIVLVYGDVNSTIAAALVCAKLSIPIGHVEAGLRSFDRSMPEEINRLITDQIADKLFAPSIDGVQNLLREGVACERVFCVGNVMIDTLLHLLPRANYAVLDSRPQQYILVTLHRPCNVDSPIVLAEILRALGSISQNIPLLFPVHPRTRERLAALNIAAASANHLHLMEPMGYLEFLALQRSALAVITDSGGIQEETTYLNVPCLTIRPNTERPITVTLGTNILVGHDMELLVNEVTRILDGNRKQGQIPPLWDGQASERIADILLAG